MTMSEEVKVKGTDANIDVQANPNDHYILKHIIAISVLLVYGIFLVYLLKEIKTEEPFWTRMMMLFTSLEAIVFAAVGYIFGREVNKKRAEEAVKDKEVAKKEAIEAQKEKTEEKVKGLKLATSVLANEEFFNLQIDNIGGNQHALDGYTSGGSVIHALVVKAKKLYPELD